MKLPISITITRNGNQEGNEAGISHTVAISGEKKDIYDLIEKINGIIEEKERQSDNPGRDGKKERS